MNQQEQQEIIDLLNASKVVVMPTDTIYGVVGRALDTGVIERIYGIKDREESKPFVILVADYSQLADLDITLDKDDENFLRTKWPGPISVVISSKAPRNLHRGKDSLAVRMPEPKWLRNIIKNTGPLIATSANLSDQKYIHDLKKINEIFSGKVDYISEQCAGSSEPSRIINIVDKANLR